MKEILSKILLFFLTLVVVVSCSETKRLSAKQKLLHTSRVYINKKATKSEEIELQLYQRPNSKILGFKTRLQLYNLTRKNPDSSYNAWLLKKPNRVKNLSKILSKKQVARLGKSFFVSGYSNFFKKVGESPVIYDSLKTIKTKKRLYSYFANRGYFNAKISHKLDTLRKNKIGVAYHIETGEPFKIDTLSRNIETPALDSIYLQIYNESLLKKGDVITDQNINNEIKRITTEFRNRGVYHFQENNIKFDIDSIGKKNALNIKVNIYNRSIKQGDSLVTKPFSIYKIGRVNIYTDKQVKEKATIIDSISFKKFNIYSSGKLHYKPKALINQIFVEEGKLFSEKDKVLTSQSLSRLGTFSFPRIQYVEDKTQPNSLIANIVLSPLKKMKFDMNADFTTSNIQDFGITGFVGVTFRNVFRGMENLNLSLRGNLGSSSKLSNPQNLFFNVREFGADLKFTFPRIVFPFKTDRIIKKQTFPTTVLTLGMSKQTNIGLDKESYTGSFYYEWKHTKKRETKYRFDLFNLQLLRNLNINNYFNVYKYSYNVLNDYAKIYGANTNYFQDGELTFPGAVSFINDVEIGNVSTIEVGSPVYRTITSIGERRKRLIEDNLILTSSFTYFLNSQKGVLDNEYFTFRWKLESSGNVVDLIASQMEPVYSDNGHKTLFGVEYSQYGKGEFEFIKHLHIRRKSSLAFRTFAGIAVPYGNSKSIPFSRSYFAGGSNDNRGWLAYSLGPGASNSVNDFNEANMKLAANLEYRFNIFSKFNGAFFLDAGNIWHVYDNIDDEELNFSGIKSLKDLALGSGFGIRYDFGLVVLRTDFGFKLYNPAKVINERWGKDVSIKEGVLNIGINYPF